MGKASGFKVICALLCLLCLFGCGGSGAVRMDLAAPVENLDPQFATGETARMLLLNLGEGLMARTPQGETVPAAAQSYLVSADGTRYTFTLREDLFWEDGEPVTAEHFAFAFRRLFTPGALSPHAGGLSALEGAAPLLEGGGFLRDLGVEAPDNHTLVFRLARPSDDFLGQLAQSYTLPCREDIFTESRGRYGLEAAYVFSNGPFTLARWNSDRLSLEPNSRYREPPAVAVTLYTSREDAFALFNSGKSDVVRVPAGKESEVRGGATLEAHQEAVWCLVFHQNRLPWGNPLLRQGMALTVDESLYAETLPAHLQATAAFALPLPRDQEPRRAFDPPRGERLFALGLEAEELDRPPAAALYVPPEQMETLAQIGQGWQRYLNLHLRLEPADQARRAGLLESGDYGLILLPFSRSGPEEDALLAQFAGGNPFGYGNPRYDALLEEGQLDRAREMLLEDAAAIPLFREEATTAFAPGLEGIVVYPFGGRMDFSKAVWRK